MSNARQELPIVSDPAVSQGAPIVTQGYGPRVVDLLDRLDAGDLPQCVADDFGLKAETVLLLMELRDLLGEKVEKEREDWRGKAEHRLNEWRLRDDDAKEAEADRDEAEAAKEMWRDRALKAEAELEKVGSG